MENQPDTRPDEPLAMNRLRELTERGQQGDQSVIPELRRVLDENPHIWKEYGDLAALAQAAWLKLLAGPDLLLQEAVSRKMDALRVELAGPTPSPLERLLVERIVACWLQLHYADGLYAQATGQNANHGFRQDLMRRQESSQRRYVAAIKQFALMRKLLTPALSPYQLLGGGHKVAASEREGKAARPCLAVVGHN